MNIPLVHNEKTTITIKSVDATTMVWDLMFKGKLCSNLLKNVINMEIKKIARVSPWTIFERRLQLQDSTLDATTIGKNEFGKFLPKRVHIFMCCA